MSRKTLVLGLGNPLMADEGIGTEIIKKLQSASEKFPEADFIDAGTGGLSILYKLQGRKNVVIIDCAKMNTAPGTIKKFTPQQVRSIKTVNDLTLHDVDIFKVVELAVKMDSAPQNIVFFGIEPKEILPRLGLSDELAARIDEYVRIIEQEISNF